MPVERLRSIHRELYAIAPSDAAAAMFPLGVDKLVGQPLALTSQPVSTPKGQPMSNTVVTAAHTEDDEYRAGLAAEQGRPAPLTWAEAQQLIIATYTRHGRCTVSCDCGALERAIDADAMNSPRDAEAIIELEDHARYAHVSPRNLIVSVTHLLRETAR